MTFLYCIPAGTKIKDKNIAIINFITSLFLSLGECEKNQITKVIKEPRTQLSAGLFAFISGSFVLAKE